MARPTSIWVCHYFGHDNQRRTTMIDYVDEIVAAYDKALGELDDGFSAVKKKSYPARTSQMIYLLWTRMQRS